MDSQLDRIRSLVEVKRWTIIGLSRDPKSFSRALFKEMKTAGYELLPVNSNTMEIDGVLCFHNIADITPTPEVALVMVGKETMGDVVKECAGAGIKTVWLYGITGARQIPLAAMNNAKKMGVELITGYCPMMFLPNASGIHHFHGWIWKMVGLYPK